MVVAAATEGFGGGPQHPGFMPSSHAAMAALVAHEAAAAAAVHIALQPLITAQTGKI